MIYMPLKFFSWEWNIYPFKWQECWLLTTHISGSLGQKLLPFFLGYTASLEQNLSNEQLTNEFKGLTHLPWKDKFQRLSELQSSPLGSVEAFASILQKQGGKKKLLFCPTLLLLLLSIYFSQESLNANFYLRVYFQDNLV